MDIETVLGYKVIGWRYHGEVLELEIASSRYPRNNSDVLHRTCHYSLK